MVNWLIHRSGKAQGPFDSEHLKAMARQGLLSPEDMISKNGTTFCKKAKEIKGLFPELTESTTKDRFSESLSRPVSEEESDSSQPQRESLTFVSYLWRHWETTRGSLLVPVLIAILLVPGLSLAKPVLGYQGLFDVTEAFIAIGVFFLIAYGTTQVASFYLGGKRSVTAHSSSVLALAAFSTLILGIVFLTPLALVETYMPETGLVVKLMPHTRRIQEDLGLDQPWHANDKRAGLENNGEVEENSLSEFEADEQVGYGFRGFSWILTRIGRLGRSSDRSGFGDEWQTVEVEGIGVTPELAKKDAFRKAVEEVVGTLVDAEILVQNERIIKDKVITASNGFIERYDEIPGSRIVKNGLHHIAIKAEVKRRNVVRRLKSARISVNEFDGSALARKIVSKMEAHQAALDLFDHQFENFPDKLIKASQVGEPNGKPTTENNTSVELTIKIEPDLNEYDKFAARFTEVLSKLAINQNEFSMDFKQRDQKELDRNKNLSKQYYVERSAIEARLQDWIPVLFEQNKEPNNQRYIVAVAKSRRAIVKSCVLRN